MRSFLFCIVLIFCVSTLQAQSFLRGKVTDESGNPLPGANLTLLPLQQKTVSDADGNFEFADLPPGNYILQITFIGFEKYNQPIETDKENNLLISLRRITFLADSVVVTATRASEKSPSAYTNISRQELEKQNLGQDLPMLLNQTPSVVITSDAGAGVGYTGIRIRGSDPTRVNVTVNGIPLNDAESHGVFWVNMPDFASSVESLQIQRGVGTSTNGAGAFGATISLQTNTLHPKLYGEISNSFGSFNTRKHTFKAGTGLLDGKWTLDGRLSRIASDGFIDRAFSDLSSYFLSGGYYGKKFSVRLNVFSGKEQTYQAWNGIPQDTLRTNRRYNAFTYDNQTDNYKQDHYQLFFLADLGKNWTLNTALHDTKGKGYYEEFRPDDLFSDYNLPNPVQKNDTLLRTDFIRRRWLDNDFYGIVASAQYDNSGKLSATFGGSWNAYKGNHFGEIIWARNAGNTNIREKYYQNNARKQDFTVYAKTFYNLTENLTAFVDLQYRQINYHFVGLNQDLQNVQRQENLHFFNPKAGLSWRKDFHTFYFSYSVAHREPTRDDFVNATPGNQPRPERLNDWEGGWKFHKANLSLNLNGFWMQYRDQLVLSGKINDVGNAIRVNIPDSYRLGLEAEVSWKITKKWSVSGNTTLSRNRIKSYTEFIPDYDTGKQELTPYSGTQIAFSPQVISAGTLAYSPVKNLSVSWISKFVDKQYLDNTGSEGRKLNAFFVNNLLLNYTVQPKFIREILFSVQMNNLFSEKYEPNGYTFSYIAGGKAVSENYYYPQAGFNLLAGLTFKF
jgi:iron complex outermembrane recepter protein